MDFYTTNLLPKVDLQVTATTYSVFQPAATTYSVFQPAAKIHSDLQRELPSNFQGNFLGSFNWIDDFLHY
jgi:hypothetical protein